MCSSAENIIYCYWVNINFYNNLILTLRTQRKEYRPARFTPPSTPTHRVDKSSLLRQQQNHPSSYIAQKIRQNKEICPLEIEEKKAEKKENKKNLLEYS